MALVKLHHRLRAAEILEVRRALDLRDFIYFPIGRAKASHDVALVGHRIGGLVASVHPAPEKREPSNSSAFLRLPA